MSRATKRKHVTREVLEEFVVPTGDQSIVRVGKLEIQNCLVVVSFPDDFFFHLRRGEESGVSGPYSVTTWNAIIGGDLATPHRNECLTCETSLVGQTFAARGGEGGAREGGKRTSGHYRQVSVTWRNSKT